MPWKFNPFTGALDQTGSGGGGSSYIDGEVEFFSDLPLSAATAPLDSAWLVRKPEGAWFLTKKHAGLYIRTATGGTDRNADYTYAGAGWPDVFSDANFTLYDDADTSKNLKFQLSGISANTTRTLTAPNASGQLALLADFLGAIKDMKVVSPSSDVTATSSTTLSNVSGMSFTVAANTTYLILTNLQMSVGAGGYNCEISFPSILNNGTTASGFGVQLTGSNSLAGLSTTSATTVKVSNRGAAQTTPSFSILLVRTDSTGGTANFQWSQNTSNAAASTISANTRALIVPLTT